MPVLTLPVVISALGTTTFGTIELAQHMLYAVTLFEPEDSVPPSSCWSEIGIMEGGTTTAHKIALLASGYVGRNSPIGWTGKIPVLSGMFLYAQLISSKTGSFKLSAILFKLTFEEDGKSIVDP